MPIQPVSQSSSSQSEPIKATTKKPYISNTQFNMYMRCPASYYYRYKKGLKIAPSGSLTLGSSAHKAIAYNLEQKIQSQLDLKLNEILDKFAATFEDLAVDTDWQDKAPGAFKDNGIRVLSEHHQQIMPTIKPGYVEHTIVFPLTQNLDVMTVIDVIDINRLLIDHKISGRTPSEDKLKYDSQKLLYAAAHRAQFTQPETGFRYDYMITTKEPKLLQYNFQITDLQVNAAKHQILTVYKAIQNHIFYPNPHNPLCTSKACGYWDLCRKEFF